jgi:hypothetical protein
MIPAEQRLPEARPLVEQGHYFVVHAPRQTGKTTALLALTRDLSAAGGRVALYLSCGSAAAVGDDYAAAELIVLSAIQEAAFAEDLAPDLQPPDPWPDAPPGRRLHVGLSRWARRCPQPIALFLDEIDALAGPSLIGVLQQFRDGFPARPRRFPASVVLCGLRDVRDYKGASGGDASRLGTASPFNVKVESLRVGDFIFDQVAALYGQHTAETGQEFTPEAIDRAFCYTQGQPWLTNALAREVITKMEITGSILAAHIDEAKEGLILTRATHLDSLVARLHEPRVQRVIEPLIGGTLPGLDTAYNDDVTYVRDLGLIAKGNPVTVANPIYREVIVRVLGAGVEGLVTAKPQHFLLPDGRLDMPKLLRAFADFWRENGDIIADGMAYHEAAPHLVLMAFLHRIVNGGGYIDREYGIGTGRIDLLIRKDYGDGRIQKEAVELKVWRPHQADPLAKGLEQLDKYLDRFSLTTGTLIIFDRRPTASPIDQRTEITTATAPSGRAITVLRA